jgi:putative ABC transport system permease protein
MLPSRITTTSGVVNEIKDQNLAEDLKPHIYLAQGQDSQLRMYLVLRTAGDPAALSSTMPSKIRELDADVPVYAVRTMSEVVDKTLTSQKLSNLLLTAFATLAFILAAIGIYGMMAVYVTGARVSSASGWPWVPNQQTCWFPY